MHGVTLHAGEGAVIVNVRSRDTHKLVYDGDLLDILTSQGVLKYWAVPGRCGCYLEWADV